MNGLSKSFFFELRKLVNNFGVMCYYYSFKPDMLYVIVYCPQYIFKFQIASFEIIEYKHMIRFKASSEGCIKNTWNPAGNCPYATYTGYYF